MARHAFIIGGGIGGLAAAAALGNDGWRVTVHERDEALPAAGTALGMWPSALRALDTLGIGNDVRLLGRAQRHGEFRRPDGSRIATIDSTAGDHTHLLSRPALLGALHRAATEAGAEIHFGTPAGDPQQCGSPTGDPQQCGSPTGDPQQCGSPTGDPQQCGSPAEDPERCGADLTVVADGVFSRTRERLFGGAYRARYSGSTAWRGVVEDMTVEDFVETWGRGVKFGVTPQQGGRTNWFATARAPEGRFHPGREVEVLRRMFDGWAAPVQPVLDALTEERILRQDVYVTPRLPSYVRGDTVLIGDAAHAMTPDLGRGACEAIIDAVTLAGCLRETTSTSKALAAYDHRRRPITQRLTRVAALAARLSQVRRALPVRDRALWLAMLPGPPN
ncbi:FAD-dependent monooxygenase [Actinoplanes couchii]|uniref:FAD-dependent monooxygenase n=1 Tax=Actinoplanes couchii TaxID=403638 RepID=UPI0031E211E8